MRDYLRTHEGELRLFIVLAALTLYLGLASPIFFTAGNLASLLNNNAVNVIWAVGLLVVLIAGGIDISFAVGASVVNQARPGEREGPQPSGHAGVHHAAEPRPIVSGGPPSGAVGP